MGTVWERCGGTGEVGRGSERCGVTKRVKKRWGGTGRVKKRLGGTGIGEEGQ